MKRILLLASLCLLIWSVPCRGADFRAGGGLILDKSIWGGGIALDMHMENLPLSVSLHTDHFNSSLFFTSFFGASLLARAEISEGKTTIFLGGGVGGSRVREKLYSLTNLDFIVHVAGRITMYSDGKLGFFSEVRQNLNLSAGEVDVTGLVGLSYKLGE